MTIGKQTLLALAFLAPGIGPAVAATTTETYMFDATLVSGDLYCGAFVGLESNCSDEFGSYSGSQMNDLMFGKSMDGVYSGKISMDFEGDALKQATCELGGADCFFGDAMFKKPEGPNAELDFSDVGSVLSVFRFTGDTGSYFFSTDYAKNEDGIHYYSRVEFDLTNVERDMAVVPLMGSAGFLLAAFGGFAAVSRRKARVS